MADQATINRMLAEAEITMRRRLGPEPKYVEGWEPPTTPCPHCGGPIPDEDASPPHTEDCPCYWCAEVARFKLPPAVGGGTFDFPRLTLGGD